jgi:hypothetical protein
MTPINTLCGQHAELLIVKQVVHIAATDLGRVNKGLLKGRHDANADMKYLSLIRGQAVDKRGTGYA